MMPDAALQDVESCTSCMCHRIVRGAVAHDARTGVETALPVPVDNSGSASFVMTRVRAINGLPELRGVLHVPDQVSLVLLEGLERLGAVSISELVVSDWESLDVCSLLLPLPRRRLLQHIVAK